MADKKVSELVAATSAGGSDSLYIIQSNTSKKITVANFCGNMANVKVTGNLNLDSSVQLLSSPGILDVKKQITHLNSDASGGALQLPLGTESQLKVLVMIATAGGAYTVASSNVAGNGIIVFDHVGDTATLLCTNSKWFVIGGTANVTY